MYSRLRTTPPQLSLLGGVQQQGFWSCTFCCQARWLQCRPPASRVDSTASSSSSSPSTTAPGEKRRSLLPETPAYDFTPGIDYYFGEDEEKRFLIPSMVMANHTPQTGNRRSGGGDGGGAASAEDKQPSTLVVINGLVRKFVIDTAVPPLRREEAERWRLEWYPISKGLAVRRRVEPMRELSLLPLDAMVTYLGDDMHKLDQLYRQTSFYTPSEVAEVFFPYIPTFPVDVRVVMQALPLSLVRKVEQDFGQGGMSLYVFSRFPMLFNYTYSRYNKCFIHLNSRYWFVRQHPGYGKADPVMRKHRVFESSGIQERGSVTHASDPRAIPLALDRRDAAGSGTSTSQRSGAAGTTQFGKRVPLSVRLFHALIRNLPRFPTPPEDMADAATATFAATKTRPYMKDRYAPLNVVQWINSFPPDDAKLLNSVPEQAVLRVLCQYVNIFQLMSLTENDPNIFVEGSVLLAEREKRKAAETLRGANSHTGDRDKLDENDDGGDVTSADGWDDDEHLHNLAADNKTLGQSTAADYKKREAFVPPSSATTSADAAERAARFQKAMQDDLIDLEDILTGPQAESTPEESSSASVAAASLSGENGSAEVSDTSTFADDDDRPGSFWDEDDSGAAEDVSESRLNKNCINYRGAREDGEESFSSSRRMRTPLPQGASVDDIVVFGLPLEEVYVRRLPPDVAPRSLSDWDETTSPDVELVALAARFLAPPPSVMQGRKYDNFFTNSARQHNPLAPPLTVWRWVSVERLYHGYTVEQRHYLRREYKGLVNFLRYHGKLFELSDDLLYVIAHDPEGKVAPIPFMQRRFGSGDRVVLPHGFDDNDGQSASEVGEDERVMFLRALGEGRVPTCRRHLLLLDPHNPIILPDVLHEEIANLLPNYPVRAGTVLHRLPPVMRAALPYRANFRASKFLEVFTERGVLMLRRRSAKDKPSVLPSAKTPMSVEDAMAELLQLPIGPDGVTIRALRYMHLSAAAVDTLCDHYGSLGRAIDSYPQYFKKELEEKHNRSYVVVKFRK